MKTIETDMKPLSEYFRRDSAYWGERGDWLVAYTVNRDSDCLARSNWRSFIHALTGQKDRIGQRGSCDLTETVAIDEANHWAVGWLAYLVIRPDAVEQIKTANETLAALEDYPVVDESDFSELEWGEYCDYFDREAAREISRGARDAGLSDLAQDRIAEASTETLQQWFESQIPSGEFHHDGYPQFRYAFDRADRGAWARLLRATRQPKA